MGTLPLSTMTAEEAYNNLQSLASSVKANCSEIQAFIAANSVPSQNLIRLLGNAQALLAAAQAVQSDAALSTAITAYMGTQTGQSTTSAGTDFTGSIAALQSLISAIAKDYPQDSAGHMLDHTISAAGDVAWLAFPAAQLVDVSTAMTAWLATVA